MNHTLYQHSVPVLDRSHQNTPAVVKKAPAVPPPGGRPPDTLMALRICPDMLPLAVQIDILASGARGAAARLAGRLAPDDDSPGFAVFNRGAPEQFGHAPATLEAAVASLAEARRYLAGIAPAEISGDAAGGIELCMGGATRSFGRRDFLLYYVLPNLHFHSAIVYALLRGAGVDLGKADFEGPPVYRLSTASKRSAT